MRFHETAALRRVCRTRLDLPRPPRWGLTDGQGLFDGAAFDEGASVAAAAAGVVSGGGEGKLGVGTTDCSLLDLAFLPESSILLGLVGGRPQVHVVSLRWF